MIGSVKEAVLDGGEFGLLVNEWQNLEQDMLKIKNKLPRDQLPAYIQLVEYPIAAMSNQALRYYLIALRIGDTYRASDRNPQTNTTVAQGVDLRRDHPLPPGQQ